MVMGMAEMDMKEKLVEIFCSILGVEPDFSNAEAMEFVEELIANGIGFVTDNNVGSKWIPVTERLPELGAEVIVCSHRTIKPVVFATYFWDAEHENWQGITHWMPLPEPPKGE